MITVYDITNTILSSITYILSQQGVNKAWLVDIGDIEPVLSYLEERHLYVNGVFLTHAHFDHFYGLDALVERYPKCKVYVSEYAKKGLASEILNLSKYYGSPINYSRDNVVVVREGESIVLFDEEPEMLFYETPGHNPGCLTMVLGNKVFSGDSYIPGIGVTTKLPHADKKQATVSLERIIRLAKGKTVYSGHQIERSKLE